MGERWVAAPIVHRQRVCAISRAGVSERVGSRAVLMSGEQHCTLIRLATAYALEISKDIRIGDEVDW
jgi:hypothetical protein